MYNDLKTVVARPEGVHKSCMGKGLDSLTAQRAARETAAAPIMRANRNEGLPPDGHTVESWAAMRRVADTISIGPITEPKPARRQPIQALRDGKSYVYFIGGEEGAIKIGVSIAPVERLIAMQMGCPIKLSILAKVEGAVALEKKYHARFGEHRSHGEWFHRHPTLLAEIRRLNRLSLRPLSISGAFA